MLTFLLKHHAYSGTTQSYLKQLLSYSSWNIQ